MPEHKVSVEGGGLPGVRPGKRVPAVATCSCGAVGRGSTRKAAARAIQHNDRTPATPATVVYQYRGVNRAGAGVVGSVKLTPQQLPGWAQAKHRAGWQRLEVDDPASHRVAEITTNDDTSRRVWWAERS